MEYLLLIPIFGDLKSRYSDTSADIFFFLIHETQTDFPNIYYA